MSESKQSNSPLTYEECLNNFKYTRDFDLYLDMLDRLKSKYLIILCLKTTTDQNIPDQTAEKIRSLGFSGFTTESDRKYVGISNAGSVICDNASGAQELPLRFEGSVLSKKLCISFEGEGAEIKLNGKDCSLNDKGINIAVYDPKTSEAADVSCYNASEGNPTFYHCNPYYDEKYIDTHIYVMEEYREKVALPLKRSYFSNRKMGVQEVEKGIFLPTKDKYEFDESGTRTRRYKTYGGVCDENFRFIAGHQLHSPRYMDLDDRHICDSYEAPPNLIKYIDETVLYGGSLIEHPGHLIAECFADRLWWIAENAGSDIKIAIETVWENGPMRAQYISFVTEFFDALGIPEDRLIVIKQPTQFKKIIIPDQSAVPLNYCFPYEFTDKYIKPFQHITKGLAPGKYKKIYLSKSKLHNKSTIGEEYFIDFFKKKGFAVINPEDYSIKEKAELMYGADEVVTIDGTNSLFTVFCRPTVKLTVLTKRMDYWDTPQQLITQALGIKEFYLVNTSGNFLDNFSNDSFVNYARGLTFVYATREFAKYVKYVYNEDLDVTPEESMKKYLYEYLAAFPEHYAGSNAVCCVRDVKMKHILRGMYAVFLGKDLDISRSDISPSDEAGLEAAKRKHQHENDINAEKIKLLTDKAKEYVEENAALKQYAAQLEAENQRLLKDLAEIGQLLDALEAGGGMPVQE